MLIPNTVISRSSGQYLGSQFIQYADYINGSDSNSGLSPTTAKKTIQAAYNALPDPTPGGGRIIVLPGRHDVGSGLSFVRYKPVVLQSLTGSRANRGWGDQSSSSTVEAVLFSSVTGAGTQLVEIATPSGQANIGYGFEFRGVFFDQTGDVQHGVYTENVNGLLFYDCGAVTRTVSPAIEQYMIRSQVDVADGGGDSSWGRVYNCETNGVGLLDGGNTGASNFNQWVVRDNVVWGFGALNRGVRMRGATRSIVVDNNIERASGATPAAEEYISCYACRSLGNGGEGAINPWLLDNDCRACHWFPIGVYGADDATATLVSFNVVGDRYSTYGRYPLNGSDYGAQVAPNIRYVYKDPNTFIEGTIGDFLLSWTGNGGGNYWGKLEGVDTTADWEPFFLGRKGATSVADGGTITHGLSATPTEVICTPSVSGEMVSVTAKGATTFTVAIKKHDGTGGTTQTINWMAMR